MITGIGIRNPDLVRFARIVFSTSITYTYTHVCTCTCIYTRSHPRFPDPVPLDIRRVLSTYPRMSIGSPMDILSVCIVLLAVCSNTELRGIAERARFCNDSMNWQSWTASYAWGRSERERVCVIIINIITGYNITVHPGVRDIGLTNPKHGYIYLNTPHIPQYHRYTQAYYFFNMYLQVTSSLSWLYLYIIFYMILNVISEHQHNCTEYRA